MLHFFKFNSEVSPPVPARDSYFKRGAGKGWPDECPPLRAASSFGWDVLLACDLTFLKRRDGTWRLEDEVELISDWTWKPPGKDGATGSAAHGEELREAGDDHDQGHDHDHEHGEDGCCSHGEPVTQRAAWFWERGQKIPHPISDNVFDVLKNQVKVSTFLYLQTDPNELLVIADVPNLSRPWRGLTAIVDTDWYPASYPWHCVLELDPREKKIHIPRGTPICRLSVVRRDTYFAREMSMEQFDSFFERGQAWLRTNGKGPPSGMMDITGAYVRQQLRSKFVVL